MNTIKTKQRGIGAWGARLAILAAGASALGQVSPASAKLFALSEEDEIKAGQQVAAQAQREYGRALPASDPMSRRVAAIGRKFAGIAERRRIPYTYTVLQNDKVLNAFAAPGGPIFVTTKLVRTTASDAELAYVLGHETAHIERRHIAKSVEKQQKVGIGAAILGAVLGRKAGGIGGTLINASMAVWQSGYSRSHEDDADAFGVRMMARLGYDPRAAATMLQKLDEGGGSRGGLDKYLSSHPAPASRIKKVNAQIQKENLLEAARRAGGPRLSDNTSYSNGGGGYANSGYGTDDQYPDDYSNSNGNGGYASAPNSGSGDDYPDYNTGGGTRGGARTGERVADLGGPLRIVERGEDSVILASAAGVARWAGARVSTAGNVTTLTRGRQKLELRRNSTVAFLNGRRQNLSLPPSLVNGVLYAPLGDLVEGVGGNARFDEQQNAIRLEIDGRESVLYLQRQDR